MEAEKQAKEFAKALEDSKALDVKTYDVRGVSGFTGTASTRERSRR